MCNPILIGLAVGAAVGAATSAATGGNVLQGALMGGIAGAAGGAFAPAAISGIGGAAPGLFSSIPFAIGTAVTTGATGLLMPMLTPKTPDYSQFGYGAQPYEPQGYSYQHATVTGSGGRQAAGVLAEEIKRTRTLRQRQQEETTAYNVAGELASTGLQIA